MKTNNIPTAEQCKALIESSAKQVRFVCMLVAAKAEVEGREPAYTQLQIESPLLSREILDTMVEHARRSPEPSLDDYALLGLRIAEVNLSFS